MTIRIRLNSGEEITTAAYSYDEAMSLRANGTDLTVGGHEDRTEDELEHDDPVRPRRMLAQALIGEIREAL